MPLRREGDNCSFFRKALPDSAHRGGQIAIPRYDDCRVKNIILGIIEQLDRDVDIGHLFLVGLPLRFTLSARDLFGQEVPLVDMHIWQSCYRIQEDILPHRFAGIVRHRNNSCREIMDCLQTLAGAQQFIGQEMKIEPIVAPPALGPEAIIEIGTRQCILLHVASMYLLTLGAENSFLTLYKTWCRL